MNVLVTGGAGFIGSHTCKALSAAGHQPVVYDNMVRGNSWAMKWGPAVEGDIGDAALIEATIRKFDIHAMMHFAAFGYVGESLSEPVAYFENNAIKSFGLLQTAQRCGVQRVVFSSTCATYGNPISLPIREDHPQFPINPYGESKLFVERMLRSFGAVYNLQWVALRYFNAAGADPDGEIGECHYPETHLIPLVLQAAADRSRPVHIYGLDFPTADGTAIRDYIHVTDLAGAHLQALEYLTNGGPSRAFNLGTGQGCSVAEIIAAVSEVTGHVPTSIAAPRRDGDPAVLIADASLALSELGWAPTRSSVRHVIETAWAWYCSPTMEAHRSKNSHPAIGHFVSSST